MPLLFVCVGFSFEGVNGRDATSKTLLLQHAAFELSQLKPTAVLGRVMKLKLFGNPSCFLR